MGFGILERKKIGVGLGLVPLVFTCFAKRPTPHQNFGFHKNY
jgi:hypothetical protein